MNRSLHAMVLDRGTRRRWRIALPRDAPPNEWTLEDADQFAVNVIRCSVANDKQLEETNWNWWIEESKMHIRRVGAPEEIAVTDAMTVQPEWAVLTNPIAFDATSAQRYPVLERHPDPE